MAGRENTAHGIFGVLCLGACGMILPACSFPKGQNWSVKAFTEIRLLKKSTKHRRRRHLFAFFGGRGEGNADKLDYEQSQAGV